ncbi:MAG: HAD-IA family hydrolase [Actinomycetota bacterium]
MKRALLLDFDGLIIDTETVVYEAWAAVFREHGIEPIDLDEWEQGLGRPDDDPLVVDPERRLLDLLGPDLDLDALHVWRRARRDELLAAEPIRPGIERWIDTARSLGLGVAVASSSPIDWVEPKLIDRGLRDRIDAVSCAGDGVPGKPDPAVYLRACALLGADPAQAVAADDTPNGVTAAKAAGVYCIGVAANMTAHLDLSHADVVVSSLAEIDAGEVLGAR